MDCTLNDKIVSESIRENVLLRRIPPHISYVPFRLLTKGSSPYVEHRLRHQPHCTRFAHVTQCIYEADDQRMRRISGRARLDADRPQCRLDKLFRGGCHPRWSAGKKEETARLNSQIRSMPEEFYKILVGK